MRFTLPKLFAAILLVALACGGLMARTRWWADGIVSLTVLLFLAAALLAIAGSGQTRVFRGSFAAIGLCYLLLVTCQEFATLRATLVTSRSLAVVAKAMQIPQQSNSAGSALYYGSNPAIGNSGTITLTAPATISAPSGYYGGTSLSASQITIGTPSDYTDGIIDNAILHPNDSNPLAVFILIGQCVWSWIIALLGAWFCAVMYGRHQRQVLNQSVEKAVQENH
ncbi:MAG TPA: hypothetical protein VGJ15_07405 [Pirellulales bacterium]|jgi:hypothetical protein